MNSPKVPIAKKIRLDSLIDEATKLRAILGKAVATARGKEKVGSTTRTAEVGG